MFDLKSFQHRKWVINPAFTAAFIFQTRLRFQPLFNQNVRNSMQIRYGAVKTLRIQTSECASIVPTYD